VDASGAIAVFSSAGCCNTWLDNVWHPHLAGCQHDDPRGKAVSQAVMTPRDPAALVAACRVPSHVREAEAGPWHLRRLTPIPEFLALYDGLVPPLAPYADYVALFRHSLATMHLEGSPGEVVMEDSPRELRRHLPLLMAARGRVLVSGLGLGCVVRGLLSLPEVEHVDVVEIDRHVVELAGGEFAGSPRCTLRLGDALTVKWPRGARWGFAWHDCWDEGGHLALLHAKLLNRYRRMAARQGAWGMPRWFRRRACWMLGSPRRQRGRSAAEGRHAA